MGRALFSSYIKSEPLVRTEPPPSAIPQDPYRTWSAWNNFDPDSEEFFDGAQYEAFLEPGQAYPETRVTDQPVHILDDNDSSSSSSESSDGDRGSPMAVGSDDPVDMIASAYHAPSWGFHDPSSWDLTPEERRYTQHRASRQIGNTASLTQHSTNSDDATTNMTSTPSQVNINATSNANIEPLPVTPFNSTENATPIDIPVDPDMPDLVGTPIAPRFQHGTPPQDLIPSPAPAFTPRIYTWNRIPATPASPTRSTHSSTRLPMTRIITPGRVRIQGFTVST